MINNKNDSRESHFFSKKPSKTAPHPPLHARSHGGLAAPRGLIFLILWAFLHPPSSSASPPNGSWNYDREQFFQQSAEHPVVLLLHARSADGPTISVIQGAGESPYTVKRGPDRILEEYRKVGFLDARVVGSGGSQEQPRWSFAYSRGERAFYTGVTVLIAPPVYFIVTATSTKSREEADTVLTQFLENTPLWTNSRAEHSTREHGGYLLLVALIVGVLALMYLIVRREGAQQ